MTRDTAISVEGLSVEYRGIRRRRVNRRSQLPRTHNIMALDGVSLEIPRGSVVGIVGGNGAGKTTLLRAMAGIIPPSTGRVVVHGRVTTLLRLGTGFKRTLSGRENVILGALAAGLKPEEIGARLAAVEEFADIGGAFDLPLRTYSSGMAGRLGFAVSVAMDPDILLVDEALSAGDGAFKEKCMNMMRYRADQENCTVVLVTHALGVVKRIADSCLWLDGGQIRRVGIPDDVIDEYLDSQYLWDSPAAFEDL